jgi:hypothetical protein
VLVPSKRPSGSPPSDCCDFMRFCASITLAVPRFWHSNCSYVQAPAWRATEGRGGVSARPRGGSLGGGRRLFTARCGTLGAAAYLMVVARRVGPAAALVDHLTPGEGAKQGSAQGGERGSWPASAGLQRTQSPPPRAPTPHDSP